MSKKLILASGSPRRKMLLESAGLMPIVEIADIDEHHFLNEMPKAYVRRMALQKAQKAAENHPNEQAAIVAADTIVVQDDEILGKPSNHEEAYKMLSHLSGCAHQVMTGVCIMDMETGRIECFVNETHVHFAHLHENRILAYIAGGEPMDKAGAYGIQGGAAGFVSHIEGSYTNVVGLPLCETLIILADMGIGV